MLVKITILHIICGFMSSFLSVLAGVIADGGEEVESSPEACGIENDASLFGKEQGQSSTDEESFESGLDGVDGELVELAVSFENLLGCVRKDVF